MNTFNDLEFQWHTLGTYRAYISFSNGYAVSVLTGDYATADDDNPYELAVLRGDKLIYPFGYDDTAGYLKAHEVTQLMKEVQNYEHY